MNACIDPRPDDGGLRVPPHSVEAEYSVLGALLIDNRAWERVADLLVEGDFYRHEHRLIYAAAAQLITAGKPADVVTVFDRLGDKAEQAGGLAYLNEVAQSVPSMANCRRYAEIVREKSVRRQVLALAADLGSAVSAPDGVAVQSAVDAAVTALLGLMQGGRGAQQPELLEDSLGQMLDELEALAEGKTNAVSTGLVDLDDITAGGGRPGELWVIGARPSMGKSAGSLSVSIHAARSTWSLFLTQEDSKLTLAQRVVANLGAVNLADLRNPVKARNPDAFWSGVSRGVDEARPLRLLVDEQGALTLADVRRKVQQAMRRAKDGGGKLGLVVVDYLQLMTGDNDNRNQMLGEIAFGLKALAKEFGVWVVLLSQLSRKADDRPGVPHMSDLRDSGDIEAAADVVVLLHREAKRKPTEENKHWMQAEVAKNKNGPTGTVNLYFDGAHQRIASWAGPVPRSGAGVRGGGGSGGMN